MSTKYKIERKHLTGYLVVLLIAGGLVGLLMFNKDFDMSEESFVSKFTEESKKPEPEKNVVTIYFNDGTILDKSIIYSTISHVASDGALYIKKEDGSFDTFSYVKYYELNPYQEGVEYLYKLSD